MSDPGVYYPSCAGRRYEALRGDRSEKLFLTDCKSDSQSVSQSVSTIDWCWCGGWWQVAALSSPPHHQH